MISLRRLTFTLLSVVAATSVIVSCTSNNKKVDSSNYDALMADDSIPAVIKRIATAVYENDAAQFARQVSYPLQRPYPLKDIGNETEMEAYYGVLMDDSLRNVILYSTPADWQQYGWRGYSVKDGEYLWVDDSIYAINYVSKRETELIDSLNAVEIKSLPKQLQQGWIPALSLLSDDSGKLYRIDVSSGKPLDDNTGYRLMIYDFNRNPGSLRQMPEQVMYGYLKTEGSANIQSYVFKDKDGNELTIMPDDAFTGVPTLVQPDEKQLPLEKAYWYELIE